MATHDIESNGRWSMRWDGMRCDGIPIDDEIEGFADGIFLSHQTNVSEADRLSDAIFNLIFQLERESDIVEDLMAIVDRPPKSDRFSRNFNLKDGIDRTGLFKQEF